MVIVDLRERALVVRPARGASAHAKLLWHDGVRALAKAWPASAAPTVWASAAGQRNVSFGQPEGDDDGLAFRFAVGDPVYRRLVSSPQLRAKIVVDVASRRILGVTFRGKGVTGTRSSRLC